MIWRIKKALIIEARKVVNSAKQVVNIVEIEGQLIKTCYTLQELGINSGGKYHGRVLYSKNGNISEYKTVLADEKYETKHETTNNNEINIEDFNNATILDLSHLVLLI